MKRLRILPIVLLLSALGFAQANRFDLPAFGSGFINGVKTITPLSGATVRVCTYPGVCDDAHLATLYTNITGVTPCNGSNGCSNPFIADANGMMGYWILTATHQYTFTYKGQTFGPYTVTANYVDAFSNQTIAGNKTFTGALTTLGITDTGTSSFKNLNGIVNVKGYGALGDCSTDEYTAFVAAQNALPSGGGILYVPSPTTGSASCYLIKTAGFALKKGVKMICESPASTLIANVSGGTVPVLISTVSGGGGYQEVANCQFQVNNASDIAVQIKGVDHASVHDNLFHHPTPGVGTDIQLDRNSVTGAYTHRIYGNVADNGGAIGLEIKGAVTTSRIYANHFFANNPVVYTSGSNGGNVFTDNTLVCYTIGAGTGIDLNSGTAAEDFKGNYFEDCLNGINARSGSTNNHQSNNHWDNVTNHVVDGNASSNGFSGIFDAEDGYIALGSSTKSKKISLTGDGQGSSPPGIAFIDTHASGKSYTIADGTSAIGEFSLKNDTSGTFPIKVSSTDAVTLSAGLTATTVSATTSVTIGSGTPILKYVEGTVTVDLASIAANTCTDTAGITVTGALDGDEAHGSALAAVASVAGLQISAYVSAADTAKVRVCNVTTGAIDPASTTYRVGVLVH